MTKTSSRNPLRHKRAASSCLALASLIAALFLSAYERSASDADAPLDTPVILAQLINSNALVAEGDTTEIAVALREFIIDMPTDLQAGPTLFRITNAGGTEHGFEIDGQGIEEGLGSNLNPGDTGSLHVELIPGTYRVYCPVGDHTDRGMSITLNVSAADSLR